MNTKHTMSVAELIEILKTMPQDLPVEINDHNRGSLSFVDRVDLFDASWESFSPDDGDYPCVVLQTETWASE